MMRMCKNILLYSVSVCAFSVLLHVGEGFTANDNGQLFIRRFELVSRDVPGDSDRKQTGTPRKDIASGVTGPEGIRWRLVEAGGEAVPPLASEQKPFILLDPVQKKASGFAGCNTFFGAYDIDSASLRFGPVGSTRRVCPDHETALEAEFFRVMDKTRGWEIRDGMLLLLDGNDVYARFTREREEGPTPDLESMTFRTTSFPSGRVTLSRGEYRTPAAPGAASEMRVALSDQKVFGVTNGRETGAVIIVTSAGGTGAFYDLALLSKGEDGWVNTDTVLLGDRVKVHSVEIKDDVIIVAMTTHGPNDPLCCPTQEVRKRFAVQGSRLVSAEEVAEVGGPLITGTVWQWAETRYNDDTRVAPVKPANYTVRFLGNGNIDVKADCNLKGGTYSTDGKMLWIQITHSIMAACEEGSLADEFMRNLTAGAIFFFKGRDLYIDLKYDTGTMKFSKQKKE